MDVPLTAAIGLGVVACGFLLSLAFWLVGNNPVAHWLLNRTGPIALGSVITASGLGMLAKAPPELGWWLVAIAAFVVATGLGLIALAVRPPRSWLEEDTPDSRAGRHD